MSAVPQSKDASVVPVAASQDLAGPAPRAAGRGLRLLVIAMLACLHVAAIVGVEDIWARGLMMAHLGLFLVWQPFMQGGQRLKVSEVVLIVLITIAILGFLNWWMLGLWVAVLSGIVGGKVFLFQARWLRAFYLTVFSYLVALLLLWIVPNGFPNTVLEPEIRLLAQYGLPALFLVMLAMPVESDTAEPQVVDFFYASLIFLLLVTLVLGSFAFMTVGKKNYVLSLTFSLFVIAAVLMFMSLAWNPRAGFSGLQMVFSRYLLSIGLPFEQWLHFLAELSRSEPRPEQFIKEACGGLARLPWVTGGTWTTGAGTGEFGAPTKHTVDYVGREVSIRLFSRHRPSPSLVWHFNLLGQLLGQAYVAKQRELKLQQQTYVQALHETGARMTHDVKNLLQTLNVLCAAAERDPDGDPSALHALMRRHLPTVLQRLQHTLDKLQRPQMDSGRFIQADAWWESLQKTYQLRDVRFAGSGVDGGILLPKDLFDSAADNMLQNALEKRKLDPNVAVSVSLECADDVVLYVKDSGRPVARAVVGGLLRGPVPSDTGYGIGLYQVARQAEMSGFSFRLVGNEPGDVRFELRGAIRRGGPALRDQRRAAATERAQR
jgi:signal transduction histidine kinase